MAGKYTDVETDHVYDGIREFDNPLPAWWLWTFAGTTVFAIIYWLGYHTLFGPGTFQEHAAEMAEYERQMAEVAVTEDELIAIAADSEAVARGAKTYVSMCASCHGERGEGKIGPNLTDAYWLYGSAPKEIWSTIAFGRTSKGMPAWRATQGPTKVRELYAYVASIQDTNLPGRAPQGAKASGEGP